MSVKRRPLVIATWPQVAFHPVQNDALWAKAFSDGLIMRTPHSVFESNSFSTPIQVIKRLNTMPFFIAEFSLAPSRLATHDDPTSQINSAPPDIRQVTTGSNPNVGGASIKKKVAVRSASKTVSR
jgi:hypothetical protein